MSWHDHRQSSWLSHKIFAFENKRSYCIFDIYLKKWQYNTLNLKSCVKSAFGGTDFLGLSFFIAKLISFYAIIVRTGSKNRWESTLRLQNLLGNLDLVFCMKWMHKIQLLYLFILNLVLNVWSCLRFLHIIARGMEYDPKAIAKVIRGKTLKCLCS